MKLIRTMDYQDSRIYVLHHWLMFQYFFHWGGHFYMQYAYAWPPWWRWLMLPFNKWKLFDSDSLDSVEESMLQGAMASLDELSGDKTGSVAQEHKKLYDRYRKIVKDKPNKYV